MPCPFLPYCFPLPRPSAAAGLLPTLRPYQRAAVAWMLSREGVAPYCRKGGPQPLTLEHSATQGGAGLQVQAGGAGAASGAGAGSRTTAGAGAGLQRQAQGEGEGAGPGASAYGTGEPRQQAALSESGGLPHPLWCTLYCLPGGAAPAVHINPFTGLLSVQVRRPQVQGASLCGI